MRRQFGLLYNPNWRQSKTGPTDMQQQSHCFGPEYQRQGDWMDDDELCSLEHAYTIEHSLPQAVPSFTPIPFRSNFERADSLSPADRLCICSPFMFVANTPEKGRFMKTPDCYHRGASPPLCDDALTQDAHPYRNLKRQRTLSWSAASLLWDQKDDMFATDTSANQHTSQSTHPRLVRAEPQRATPRLPERRVAFRYSTPSLL